MQRVHLRRHDLDWLPPSFRFIRWTVAGTIWGGMAIGFAAAVAFAHLHVFIFGKGLVALAAGGYYAGDRVARGALHRRLRRLASGDFDLSRLPASADGELVHVRGRVRALESVHSLLTSAPAVYRRLLFSVDETPLVHETGRDFWLVADGSEPVLVEVEHARLLDDRGRPVTLDPAHPTTQTLYELGNAALLQAAASGEARGRRGRKPRRMSVNEVLLRDGDEVEVIGYKARTVDLRMATRLERDTPYRATLRGGSAMPLLISRA